MNMRAVYGFSEKKKYPLSEKRRPLIRYLALDSYTIPGNVPTETFRVIL